MPGCCCRWGCQILLQVSKPLHHQTQYREQSSRAAAASCHHTHADSGTRITNHKTALTFELSDGDHCLLSVVSAWCWVAHGLTPTIHCPDCHCPQCPHQCPPCSRCWRTLDTHWMQDDGPVVLPSSVPSDRMSRGMRLRPPQPRQSGHCGRRAAAARRTPANQLRRMVRGDQPAGEEEPGPRWCRGHPRICAAPVPASPARPSRA